jgi:transcriptional regulator with PAS, ATPase and Fis domain
MKKRSRWGILRCPSGMLEKEMILRALKAYGSQRKAAVPLNIDQSTLARKVKRYGIRTDAIMHYVD